MRWFEVSSANVAVKDDRAKSGSFSGIRRRVGGEAVGRDGQEYRWLEGWGGYWDGRVVSYAE